MNKEEDLIGAYPRTVLNIDVLMDELDKVYSCKACGKNKYEHTLKEAIKCCFILFRKNFIKRGH